MFSFLLDFIRNAGQRLTVIVLDQDGLNEPRRYRVKPAVVFGLAGVVMLIFSALMVLLVVQTPIRGLIPGLASEPMRREARLNSLRLEAMEDSLAAQADYLAHIRSLVLGNIQPGDVEAGPATASRSAAMASTALEPLSENWEDHQQPALPLDRLPVDPTPVAPAASVVSAADQYMSAIRFPVLPPVTGLFTRGFDARGGHFAIDLAVAEGSVVRAVGDGYVILADWTHEGGHVIAVQHVNGYLSVYKHNQRLLKRVGDRVRDREAIALSGNTGEITTGPHLHFELWRDGLAQDPREYLLSL